VFLQNSRRRLFSRFIELFFSRKVHGIGPRGCAPGVWQSTGVVHGFIKRGPSARRSTTHIKNTKGYPLDPILTVGFDLDGTGVSPSSGPAWLRQSTGVPWPLAWESSTSLYGSPNSVLILPMRSRLWEELVLPTYKGRNGPQKGGRRGGGSGGSWSWWGPSPIKLRLQ
jgi:hypothetical protein